MIKKDWFLIGSIIFFLWGIINTWFGISRYGIDQGMYLWFCNLALFAVAYGLLKKHTDIIIAFLSIGLLTQSFWIIDNTWRVLTKKNLFGLIEFMYQPGYPLDEFLASHYHYFMIPALTLALFFLPKQKGYNTTKIILLSSAFIFSSSYFLFPPEQNLNCIRESCFPNLERWKGPVYSLIFVVIVTLVCIGLAHFIEKFHKKNLIQKYKTIAVFVFCMVFLASVWITSADISYKRTLPKFKCSSIFEDSKINLYCKYNTEFKNEQIWLVYTIKNKLLKSITCTSKIYINGEDGIMHSNLHLEANKKYNIGFILPYPKEDATARLSALCY